MVPTAMERSICFFYKWRTITKIIEINSGSPWLPVSTFTSLRQYMTKSPNTAQGRYLQRYCTNLGVSFPEGKTKKEEIR